MEGSLLLASIRETGGVQGLRKTGVLRSPPPRERPASPLGAANSQRDLVSALVAALQQRQTRVTYSDDEGSSSDDDDSWEADN
jgi:Wiskott-Aldrich syndrome protein